MCVFLQYLALLERVLIQHNTPCSFIGQLTIMRFRGDTTFGFVARIIATFFGGLLGTVLW